MKRLSSKQVLQKANEQRHRWIFIGGAAGVLWLYVSSGASPVDPEVIVTRFDTSAKTTVDMFLVLVKYREELLAAGSLPLLAWIANVLRKK